MLEDYVLLASATALWFSWERSLSSLFHAYVLPSWVKSLNMFVTGRGISLLLNWFCQFCVHFNFVLFHIWWTWFYALCLAFHRVHWVAVYRLKLQAFFRWWQPSPYSWSSWLASLFKLLLRHDWVWHLLTKCWWAASTIGDSLWCFSRLQEAADTRSKWIIRSFWHLHLACTVNSASLCWVDHRFSLWFLPRLNLRLLKLNLAWNSAGELMIAELRVLRIAGVIV